jgi:hypothetical protein
MTHATQRATMAGKFRVVFAKTRVSSPSPPFSRHFPSFEIVVFTTTETHMTVPSELYGVHSITVMKKHKLSEEALATLNKVADQVSALGSNCDGHTRALPARSAVPTWRHKHIRSHPVAGPEPSFANHLVTLCGKLNTP